MNYPASFQDFFKSPKWTMNLLLAAVCSIIPVAGPMVVLGWLLAGFWGRNDDRPETFPDFTFDNFGDKLQRGLWPTLVGIVVGVVLSPVLGIVFFIGMFVVGGAAVATGGENAGGLLLMLGMLTLGIVILLLALVAAFFFTPVVLRSALMQDFGAGFNMAFVKRFLGLVKKELLLCMGMLGAVSLVLMVVAIMLPCLGYLLIVAVVPVTNYMWAHLTKQLYQLYVSRGGEPIPLSPKLVETPPPSAPAPMA